MKSLSIYGFEAFSTPFSLSKPWIDGTFRFPAEWTWENGQLTSDIDAGRGFPYLHFKYWKEGADGIVAHGKRHWRELRRLVYIDPSEVKNGFRINCYGFHPLGTDKPCPDFIDAQWKLFLRRTKNMVRFHLGSKEPGREAGLFCFPSRPFSRRCRLHRRRCRKQPDGDLGCPEAQPR